MIANGGFRGNATGWTLTNASYLNTDGEREKGCTKLEPTAGAAASAVQSFGGPGGDPVRPVLVRLTWAAKQLAGICTQGIRARIYDAGGTGYLDLTYTSTSWGTWLRFEETFYVPEATYLTVDLSTAAGAPAGKYWLLDDVVLRPAVPYPASIEGMALECRKRRNDWPAVKHPEERYRELVAQALGEAPMGLWEVIEDDSLETVEDVRLYDLATLTRLTNPKQVQRVYLADEDGNLGEIGRWEVRPDESGGLVLALDTDPEDERAIRLEYLAPWAAPDPDDWSEETGVDREWTVCKAMTLLLMEAAVEDRDPRLHMQELAAWDAKRAAREAQAGRRRRAARLRSHDWSTI